MKGSWDQILAELWETHPNFEKKRIASFGKRPQLDQGGGGGGWGSAGEEIVPPNPWSVEKR